MKQPRVGTYLRVSTTGQSVRMQLADLRDDLRHTFASRLTEAGVSPIFVAQIMGHASPNILQTYAKANDEFRRAAICSLEAHREAQCEKIKNQHPQMIQ